MRNDSRRNLRDSGAHSSRKRIESKQNLNDSFVLNKSRDMSQTARASMTRANESFKQLHKKPNIHKVHEHPIKGVYIEGLSEVNCDDSSDAYACFLNGLLKKRVSQTSRNVHSSRSHTIF